MPKVTEIEFGSGAPTAGTNGSTGALSGLFLDTTTAKMYWRHPGSDGAWSLIDASIDALSATATELNALDLDNAFVARTATADGLTTGTIAAAGMIQSVAVTSANAAHIIVLPAPTPGRIVILHVGANGFELQSSAPATVGINGGTGAAASSAIAANSTCIMLCVSATSWKGFFMDADSDLAKVEAAN